MTRSRYVAQAGVIAALYAAFTWLTLQLPGMLGWGLIQFRLSEALTVLAVLTPAAVPGLTLGAVAANLTNLGQIGPLALLDVVFGSLATMLGAMWTWRFRDRTALALAGPVVTNALIVPLYLPILVPAATGLYTIPLLGVDLRGHWWAVYLFGVLAIALGQAVVVYGLGLPLLAALRRLGVDRMFADG